MSIYTEKRLPPYYGDDDFPPPEERLIPTGKKGRKIMHDPSKHYPNKNEAALLRKIMAETGLNEEEVRSDRHYCELLSDAQKAGQKAKRSEITKFYQDLIKDACKKTGLAPQHPDTLKVLDEIIKDRQGRSWGRRFFLYQNLKSAEAVVKQYAKK